MSGDTEPVELVGEETTRNVARAALFAALVAAFAYVKFPNPLAPGIPVTLQVLGVFLAGAFLGWAWGGASMLLLLVVGGAGAPVFANGSGLGYFLGPTGGYLLSYPIAAGIIGWLAHGLEPPGPPGSVPLPRLVGAFVAGTLVIYAIGTVWFSWVQAVPIARAVFLAAVPFVPAEAAKLVAAVGIVRSEAIAAR